MLDFLAGYGCWGLFLASFLAATIVPLSSEAVLSLVLYSGAAPFLCWFSATLGNVLGALMCYWIGRLGKIEWMERYLKISYDKLQKAVAWMRNKGSVLAIFTFLPIVGDLIAVALGYMRSNLLWVIIFTFLGKGLRYFVWMLMHDFVANLF